MKRKNATRNALITSIISVLLCVSMLVGTTFAWFTDEVVTGMNTISAGNLDIELLADGKSVTSGTKLFDDVALWEPGVVVYENLQVANVGTLALKYQMTLNFGNENDLNGHKLSEVLQVAIIDKVSANATREQVLAAAKASTTVGTLGNFYLTGDLEAGEAEAEQAIVIFWAPNANEIDNLYNANNGQVTSDGQPLHIEFGINLQATQLMSEADSFGNDYDEFATILPKAKVTDNGAETVSATDGLNGPVKQYNLPFVLQFEPNETLEQAKSSAYKYWHADYVVKADRDVPADSLALVGYYAAYCDGVNNGNWVALTAADVIPAGTEVRLVDVMGGGDGTGNGSIKVTYKDICQWGNDGTGFLCSATDLTGENAGTTLTVELRMYANESDPTDSSYNGGTETGEYYVIGTYSYTFGAVGVSTADELAAVLTSDWENISVVLANDIDLPISSLGSQTPGSGEYKLGGENTKAINIDLNGHKLNITTTYWSAIGAKNNDATITIKNGSMTSSQPTGTWNSYDVTFANCNYVIENVTFDKAIAFANEGKAATLKNVTINETHDYYAIWITAEGQTVTVDGLTVNSEGRGIKIDEQYVGAPSKVTLKVSNASFNTNKKAAIMVKSAAGADIALSNIDISGVATDSTNAVWVDSDAVAYADLVTVTGGSIINEP